MGSLTALLDTQNLSWLMSYHPKFFKYIGDCLVISKTRKIIETFICKLNVLHDNIIFTEQIEINNQVPYFGYINYKE